MRLNPNLFDQYFAKPKVSRFNRTQPVSTDLQVGPLYPLDWDLTGFGDTARGSSIHKMRLAPLMAPNFADLRFQEHTIVVPLRTIMTDFQQKFNYSKNIDGASLPVLEARDLLNIYKSMGILGINPIGSVFDFLGFPVFADFFDQMVLSLSSVDDAAILPTTGSVSVYNLFVNLSVLDRLAVSYRGVRFVVSNPEDYFSLLGFGLYFYGKTLSDWNAYSSGLNLPIVGIDSAFVQFLSDGLTMTALIDQYHAYMFTKLVAEFFLSRHDSDSVFMEEEYSLLPLMAYHRAVSDWNLNSNITDPELYQSKFVFNLKSTLIEGAADVIADADVDDFITAVSLSNRLYDNDFFTSLLPTSAQGDAITIPANATVLDLAKLSAFQKFILKASYSSRFRDSVWNIFNVRPSDARLEQSSVIRAKTHYIAIGETIQTSETTPSSVLGSFSGRAFSAGNNKGYHIFCEEPCVVLNFGSLVASPYYADALHPLIKVNNILDFPLPDMDVLGNQPVYSDMLSGNPEDSRTVLGYGRQYYEWLASVPTVHGRMKTSLRYWQMSRRFTNTPVFNEDFVTINPNDDLDDIFTIPDSSHAFLEIIYKREVTRPIHRSVRIVI